MPAFPMSLSIPHNINHQAIPPEFWHSHFGLQSASFNPSLIHQNVIPAYKLPTFQAFLSQYMGLGIFNYQHNVAVAPGISPQSSNSKDSPTMEAEKNL